MPTVPVSRETSVRTQALPGVRVNTEQPLSAFGGGDSLTHTTNAARGLVNDVSSKAMDIMAKQKQDADEVRLQAADLELSKAQTDVQVQVKGMTGENAFGAPDYAEKEWKKRSDKIREGLSDDRQKAQFDKIHMARSADLYKSTQMHVAGEAKQYDLDTTNAYVENAQNQAALNYMDVGPNGMVEQSIYIQEQALTKYGYRNGVPAPVMEQKIAANKSKTYTAVIRSMIQNQAGPAANEYLKMKKADISQDDQKQIEKMFKDSSQDLEYSLNEMFINGTLTIEAIQAASYKPEEGGIGVVKAQKLMKDMGRAQTDNINLFKEDNKVAEKYVDAVESILKGVDNFKAKQILVDAMSDNVMSSQESQKINRLADILEKKKNTRDNSIWTQIPIIKNWNIANESDNRELANAISNYTNYLDQGQNPEDAAESVLRSQYNNTYPQAPLGPDDKVIDPKREREISFQPVQRFFKGVARGASGTVESFGSGLEWLGAKEVGKAFEEWGKTAKNFYAVEDPTYLDQVYEGLGSMSTFFIPGLGISKGVQIARIAPSIARWIGVGTATVLEEIVNAGDTYKQAIENGYGEKSASLSATATFWGNLPQDIVLNRFGVFGDKGPKILQVLTAGTLEGAQEFSQAVVGNIALSDPINWKEATVSASIGAITGSGVKTAETVTQTLDDLGVAKEFMNDLKVKLKSERGSIINPVGDSNQEPINIQPKDANDPLNYATAEEYVASKGQIVYHGTPEGGFEKFDESMKGKRTGHKPEEVGFHFTDNPEAAESYSGAYKKKIFDLAKQRLGREPTGLDMPKNPMTYEAVLDMKNPLRVGKSKDVTAQVIKDAQAQGYDSIITDMGNGNEYIVFKPEQIQTKSQLISEWEAAQKKQTDNPPSQFEGFTDKQLVNELADLVSNFEPGQTIVDEDGNYSRLNTGFMDEFSNKGYTQEYLQNIYSKYIAGEKLTNKQSEDLVYTLNSFKEMFGIKTSENIPDIVTSDNIKQSKANQAIVKQIGKMLAKKTPASKVKGIVRESTGQVKEQGGQVSERTAFLQSLKDRVKAAKQAETATREQIFDTQRDLIDLITNSEMEAADKAKFLPMIKNVQTAKDLKKVLEGHTNKKTGEVTPGLEERINKLIEREERRQVVGKIKKTIDRAKESKSIAVDYVNTIEQIVSDVDFKNRRPETIERIERMKDFLDRKIGAGEDVAVTREMLKDLSILEKAKLEDLSNADLERMLQNVEKAVQLGETKLGALQATRQAKKERALEELKKGSVPINSKEVTRPKVGQALSGQDKLRNQMSESYNYIQDKNLAIVPQDVVFDILDGNKNYTGPNYKIFKQAVDKAYSKYLKRVDSIVESVQKLANELKLNEASLERIGFYAAKVQRGGVEKLQGMGYTEAEIEAIKLTADENKLYTTLREKLDALRPDIQEVMRLAYNKNLDVVDDYFPFMTDFEAMNDKELRDRFGDTVELIGQANRKNVEKGFTKSRTGGKQKIKLNALEVFYNHIDNASYLIELGPTIKDLGDIAETEDYGKAVGDVGQERVREWIDLLARKGNSAGQRIRILDTIRRNVGVATLGLKLSSALVQPTALLDGASIIGGRAFQGAYDVASSKEWRQFLKQNFPELRARGADDPAYLEFGGKSLTDKAGRAGFWVLRNLDILTASSVTAGAYRMAVEDKGGTVDFSKPDADAIVEAQRILRRTQSSVFAKDLPSAISQGGLTGNISLDRLLLQFQSFMLNRWSLIQHDMWAAGIKEGEIGKAMNIFFFLAMANFAEIGIRRFSKELLASMTDENLDDWDETFNKEIVMAALGNVPFVSQATSAINYGSIPVPAVDMGARIIQKLNAAAKAKKQSTRDRNLVRGLALGLGVAFRVPGTVQGEQILRAITGEDKKKKRAVSPF